MEDNDSQFHVFHDHGQMFMFCLICQTVTKYGEERLQKLRMVCNNNKASNNKAKKRKVMKSNTTNMHSSLNDTAQTTSNNVQDSSDDIDGLNSIDEALAKLFFGCNIPFAVVESTHFKNFVYLF